MAQCVHMTKKHITLADPVAEVIRAQISAGRYKDTSAALNDAAWHHFIGTSSPFQEYGVTTAQVERSARKDLEEIRTLRRRNKLVEL